MTKLWCPRCGAEFKRSFKPKGGELLCDNGCGPLLATLARPKPPGEGKPGSRRRQGFAEASEPQREKVRGRECIACGRIAGTYVSIDPAHLVGRSAGGCDDPDCVVPLCRTWGGGCHRLYDDLKLDLLKPIARRWPLELAEYQHMLTHLHPVSAIQQLANAKTQWDDLPGVAA